ncbi:YjhX family toxin [uncultured Shimia sp.]|uniref:YjhX family toxin n=1 Tax=uncultured Shimia sp. TaxID=573152 RepID=UPI002629B39D|nr:YjhX family toxin [uncultured Shimia sp.]
MNISKVEQRVLHVLAQGGAIHFERLPNGKVSDVTCFNRDLHVLSDCTLEVFERLKKRRMIRSVRGQPYRVTKLGITSVRAQLDNR